MTYVDEIATYPKVKTEAQRYGKNWCHLWADSLEELLEFAKILGLNVKWLQNSRGFYHFDLVPSKRDRAIDKGAKIQSLRVWYKEKSSVKKHTTP